MSSRKLAQMAVALKTCEILHKEGELVQSLSFHEFHEYNLVFHLIKRSNILNEVRCSVF